MNKKLFSFSLAAIAIFVLAKPSLAAERCETQYGGGETCVRTGELQIDKEIYDPEHKGFVDNMGPDDYLFKSAEEITFKLKIKNVGDDTLSDVDVKDVLPSYLFFSGGSTDSFHIDDLNPGETEEKEIKATVVAESQLPSDKSLICDFNTAEAKSGDDEHDKDTAKFCFGKKVLGITTLPKTGSPFIIPALIISSLSGLAGFALVKISK